MIQYLLVVVICRLTLNVMTAKASLFPEDDLCGFLHAKKHTGNARVLWMQKIAAQPREGLCGITLSVHTDDAY